MLNINRKITLVNRTLMNNKRNMWLIIHYVGAVSTAKANASYFYDKNRKASAHYFVDENEIWQVVEDKDASWHIGALVYHNSARNSNSIGIEMCCKRQGNKWYFEEKTIQNTIELTRYLMKKYNIPIERVARHYDCTGKICPQPYVADEKAWQDFLKKVQEEEPMEEKELTIQEKCKEIQKYYNLDENTTLYFQMYRFNVPLIEKLYYRIKNH